MLKIAVLVSGGGTNLQAVIDAIKTNKLNASIDVVIADRECYGLERARIADIKDVLINRKIERQNLCTKISEHIADDCDLIVLAGFLSILDSAFIAKWCGKIINIHPSLLPKFGGSGMWGMNVHKAVVAAGETKSGCTVHYVVDEIDGGEIILQREVSIFQTDKPEDVQKKILAIEHIVLVEAIQSLIK